MFLVRQRHVPALKATKHGWTNGAGSKPASWVHWGVPEGCFRHGATLPPTSLGMQQADGIPVKMSQPLPASSLSLKPLFHQFFSHYDLLVLFFYVALCF